MWKTWSHKSLEKNDDKERQAWSQVRGRGELKTKIVKIVTNDILELEWQVWIFLYRGWGKVTVNTRKEWVINSTLEKKKKKKKKKEKRGRVTKRVRNKLEMWDFKSVRIKREIKEKKRK